MNNALFGNEEVDVMVVKPWHAAWSSQSASRGWTFLAAKDDDLEDDDYMDDEEDDDDVFEDDDDDDIFDDDDEDDDDDFDDDDDDDDFDDDVSDDDF